MCLTSKEKWEIIKKTQIWGVPKRNQKNIEHMKIGDKCLIYVRQYKIGNEFIDPTIVGDYVVDSEVFFDQTKIFADPENKFNQEIFPYRIKLKKGKNIKNPIDFRQLIPKLSFITNKKNWASHLQGYPARKIPDEDYKLILSNDGLE